MKGREESDARTEKIIDECVSKYPYYIVDFIETFGNKTATTKLNYVRKVCTFLDYLKEKNIIDINEPQNFAKLLPSKVNAYMNTLQTKSESTQAQTYYALQFFFKYLKADRYIKENIFDDIDAPKVQNNKEVVAMNSSEIKYMKGFAKNGSDKETEREKARRAEWRERDFAIVQLGITTGMRVTSISEINLEDIDYDNMTISVVEKGNKRRLVYLDNRTLEAIKEWIAKRESYLIKRGKNSNALFISNQCKRISIDAIQLLTANFTKGINKHITPHKMRSSCATNLYDRTGDIYLVMNQLGHSNINNTKRYTRINESRRREASNILGDM